MWRLLPPEGRRMAAQAVLFFLLTLVCLVLISRAGPRPSQPVAVDVTPTPAGFAFGEA
jgi:hypothetical protein